MSDLQITPRRDVVDAFSIHGGRSRENLRAWIDVRITLDRFTDRGLFRKFSGMINHLERGGSVSFGNDSAKCWAGNVRTTARQGETGLNVSNNLCKTFHSSAPDALANTDEIVIESVPPKAGREYHRVNSHTYSSDPIGRITLLDSLHLMDDFRTNSRVRHSDFFPTLILPTGAVGSAMLTHDHRITYTLDLNLSYVVPYPRTTVQTESEEAMGSGGAGGDSTDKPDFDAG